MTPEKKTCGWMDSGYACKEDAFLVIPIKRREFRICKRHLLRFIRGHVKTMEGLDKVLREEGRYGTSSAIRWGPYLNSLKSEEIR